MLLLTALLACGPKTPTVQALPAAAPAPPVVKAPPPDLSGSWTVTVDIPNDGRMRFTASFSDGTDSGALDWGHPNDSTTDNDFWVVEGDTVLLMINDEYVRYQGQFVTNDAVRGEATNIKGTSWGFAMVRELGGADAPMPVPSSTTRADLPGSLWAVSYASPTGEPRLLEVALHADGGLSYWDDGFAAGTHAWSSSGNTFSLALNGGYVTYNGIFANQDVVRGEASNTQGESWPFVMIYQGRQVSSWPQAAPE